MFTNTHRNFSQFGIRQREPNLVNDNRDRVRRNNQIFRIFDVNQVISTRRAAQQMQIYQSTVWRTLHSDFRKPFHFQPVQNLQPEDPPRRLAFCRWMLEMVEHDN